MGTTAEKLQAVVNAKTDIEAAITEKGGIVSGKLSEYGDAIRALPGGGMTTEVITYSAYYPSSGWTIMASDMTQVGDTSIWYSNSKEIKIRVPLDGIGNRKACHFSSCIPLQLSSGYTRIMLQGNIRDGKLVRDTITMTSLEPSIDRYNVIQIWCTVKSVDTLGNITAALTLMSMGGKPSDITLNRQRIDSQWELLL